jgi:hypothetical protein
MKRRYKMHCNINLAGEGVHSSIAFYLENSEGITIVDPSCNMPLCVCLSSCAISILCSPFIKLCINPCTNPCIDCGIAYVCVSLSKNRDSINQRNVVSHIGESTSNTHAPIVMQPNRHDHDGNTENNNTSILGTIILDSQPDNTHFHVD